jgi:hypothetical protein
VGLTGLLQITNITRIFTTTKPFTGISIITRLITRTTRINRRIARIPRLARLDRIAGSIGLIGLLGMLALLTRITRPARITSINSLTNTPHACNYPTALHASNYADISVNLRVNNSCMQLPALSCFLSDP